MEFFGHAVKKTFRDIGTFTGKVVDYHWSTGYRVEYEDGDSEDLTHKELVSGQPHQRECSAPCHGLTPRWTCLSW